MKVGTNTQGGTVFHHIYFFKISKIRTFENEILF